MRCILRLTPRPLLVRLWRRLTGAPGHHVIGSPRGQREAVGPAAAAIETHLRVSDEGITFTPVPTSRGEQRANSTEKG